MLAAQLVTFLLCLFALGYALLTMRRVMRSMRKRRWLLSGYAAAADASDGAGISVLCSGIHDAEQLEQLLGVEYARYEVVLALDARLHFALFDAIVSRYRMIRVNYAPSGELPVKGVRGLYRSRRRAFRRLVVIDRMQTTPYEDFDAAGEVAAYDFLLPVQAGSRPVQGVVERLAAELALAPCGAPELVRSPLGVPAALVCREAVLREGGFGPHTGRSVRRERRLTLYEPLLCRPVSGRAARGWCAAGILIAAGAVAALWLREWTAVAVTATAAALWCAGRLVVLLVNERIGSGAVPRKHSV